jgi:hypothetical protein
MKKLEFAQVKTILLVCCGQGFNKEYQGHYNRYKVLIDGEPIEKLYDKDELKELGYWSNRSNVLAMTCWGTSQEFEAQLAVGRFLIPIDERPQEWGEYTRMVTDKVKAIY